MTRHPNHPEDAGPAPIKPAQILDPYPERATSETGVRPHTQSKPASNRKYIPTPPSSGPLPFAAKPPAWALAPSGRRLWPLVSIGLYALGQLMLAVAIAAGSIDPALAIVVCICWLVCGLLLIAAEAVSQRSHDQVGHGNR